MKDTPLNSAVKCLKSGGVIAYPTESIFGLGCDANNLSAVSRVLKIKKRETNKGLILLVSDILQASRFIRPLNDDQLAKINASSKRAITWLLEKSFNVSHLIVGEHPKIAIRVTTHPIAKALCQQLGSPLVSTSCNLSGAPPYSNVGSIRKYMSAQIDQILEGDCGAKAPSKVIDLDSGAQIR